MATVECYNWELSVVIPFRADTRQALEARADELAFYKRPVTEVSPICDWWLGR